MSKSIYDEALKHLNILNNFVIMWCDEIDLNYHDTYKNNYQKVKKALEKAQKQERVLELYKEINNKRKELITLARHNTWSWELDIEINEMQDKIKEL